MSAYLDSQGIQRQTQKPTAGHRQGRYVMQTDGYLLTGSGNPIDLHGMLTEHSPSVHITTMATGILRASGILPGGFLVVDRAIQPQENDMVYVRYNGMPVIRRLAKKNGSWCLMADDPREPFLYIGEETTVERLGVVTWALNPVRRGF